jgi:hypothetical protein
VLCFIPYFADGLLALVAGVLNPAGLFYVVASALPSTLGANAGLLSLPSIMHNWTVSPEERRESIHRSTAWLAIGAIASLLFIVVLGRGISFSR